LFAEFRIEPWRHGDEDMETWKTWRHGDMETWRHGDMETWKHGDKETFRHRHEDMETSNGNRMPRRFSTIRFPFAHYANGSLSFVRLLTKKHGSYPFANGLNGRKFVPDNMVTYNL
jgi:hypothetical protein